MSNLTKESLEYNKRSGEYDEMFFSLLDKINAGVNKEDKVVFNTKEKTLYLTTKIQANNKYFVALCDGYKFFIAKSLF